MILDESGREPGDARGAGDAREPSAASGSAESFDPKYAPEFQRGYKPRPGERSRTRVREEPPTDSAFRRPGADDAPTVAPYAVTDRDVRTDYAEAPEESEEVDPLLVHFAELADDDEQTDSSLATIAPVVDEPVTLVVGSILDRVDVSPKRNPYFLALWILGGGFIVLGIVLYAVSVYTSYTSSSTELDLTTLVFSQIGWMLAAPLVSVGLATIVALVLLSALRARPARPSVERD